MKSKGGGWTGRTWNYIYKTTKDGAIHYQWRESRSEPAFTFTAEQEREIRRAFGGKFPVAAISSFIRSVAGALTKVASDKGEPATDPRMARELARDRAETVAALLAKAAFQIAKMTEVEKDIFELATGGDSVELGELVATLDKAAMGFARAADGLALQRGEKVAGPGAEAMFVAATAAVAWREAFGIEPVEHDGSDFVTVLDVVLAAAGLPVLGRDAIQTAIMGPPKNRK